MKRLALIIALCLIPQVAAAAITVVTTSSAGSLDTRIATTSGVDTTGVNLIVLNVTRQFDVTTTVSDSKGNTWTPLTDRAGTDPSTRLYYCVAPTVGSGHTFTADAGAGIAYPSICVVAIAGAAASPFDQQSGGNAAAATSSQPGSITPSEANCILVTGVNHYGGTSASINSGFTAVSVDYSPGAHIACGIAYKIQTTAGAENPTWSWSGSWENATAMASFKAAATGGGTGGAAMYYYQQQQ